MISVADLPEIDEPQPVAQVAEDLKTLGKNALTIVINSDAVWQRMREYYHDKNQDKVYEGLRKPRAIAEALNEKCTQIHGVLKSYAERLEDLQRRKEKLKAEIEAAIAELRKAEDLEKYIERPDPDNPDETIREENEERQRAIDKAEETLSRLAGEVETLRNDVMREDRSTASTIRAYSSGSHMLEQASDSLTPLNLLTGLADSLGPLIRQALLFNPNPAVSIPAWLKWGDDFLFDSAELAFGLKETNGGDLARVLTEAINEHRTHRTNSSITRHTLAWAEGKATDFQYNPGYEIGYGAGEVSTFLIPGGVGAAAKGLKGMAVFEKAAVSASRRAVRHASAETVVSGYGGAISEGMAPEHAPAPISVSAVEFYDGQGRQELINAANTNGDVERANELARMSVDEITLEYGAMKFDGGGDPRSAYSSATGYSNPFGELPKELWTGDVAHNVNTGAYAGETDFPQELPDRIDRARGEAPEPKTTVTDYVNDGVREVRVEVGQNTTIYRYTPYYVETESQLNEKFTAVDRKDGPAARSRMHDLGRVDGDQAGHLQAHMFSPNTGTGNYLPQNGDLNMGAYKNMEEIQMKAIQGNDSTVSNTTSAYLTPSGRPSEYDVDFDVFDRDTGKQWLEGDFDFKNEAGQKFYPDPAKYSQPSEQPNLTAKNMGNVKSEGMANGPIRISNPQMP